MWDTVGHIGPLETEIPQPRRLAIEALVKGTSVTSAALAAGVARSTLNRWLNEPEFAAALSQAKRAYLTALQARMRGLANSALIVLDEALCSPRLALAFRATLALRILKAVGADMPEDLGPQPLEPPASTEPAEPAADTGPPLDADPV
jgi:hypothetical protein